MKNLSYILLFLPFLGLTQAQEANLLGTWFNDDIAGTTLYNNAYNEIWGIARNAAEYAIIGSTQGTHFINVTDPTNPVEDFYVAGADQGTHIIHRDYHDYGDYLYAVCDEGSSTLQIIDISQLPNSIEVVYDSAEKMAQAHNIFIDEENGIMYCGAASGGSPGYSALRLYMLEPNPLNPLYLGEWNTFGGLEVGHVHDIFARNGVAFLNCGNSGFAIVDFTTPTSPITLSTLTEYPDDGYNHSGWLDENCAYYYMADENHGHDMKVVDVQDPCNIEVVNTFNASSTEASSIPHNQIVACNYLYVSYYYDGFRVYDISDPINPEQVLYYDTYPSSNDNNYRGNWGIYPFLPSGNILLSDMQKGLFVLEGMGDNCTSTAATNNCNVSCSLSDVETAPDFVTGLDIFPHPVEGELNVNVSLTERQTEVNLDLLDINGRLVQRLAFTDLEIGDNSLQFDLDVQMSGIYLLKLQSERFVLTRKVVLK